MAFYRSCQHRMSSTTENTMCQNVQIISELRPAVLSTHSQPTSCDPSSEVMRGVVWMNLEGAYSPRLVLLLLNNSCPNTIRLQGWSFSSSKQKYTERGCVHLEGQSAAFYSSPTHKNTHTNRTSQEHWWRLCQKCAFFVIFLLSWPTYTSGICTIYMKSLEHLRGMTKSLYMRTCDSHYTLDKQTRQGYSKEHRSEFGRVDF